MVHIYVKRGLAVILIIIGFSIGAEAPQGGSFVKTEINTTLISINDGEAGALVAGAGQALGGLVPGSQLLQVQTRVGAEGQPVCMQPVKATSEGCFRASLLGSLGGQG